MSQVQQHREKRKQRARASAQAQLRANIKKELITRDQLLRIFGSITDFRSCGGEGDPTSDRIHRRVFKIILGKNGNFGLAKETANIIIDGLADRVGLIFWKEFVDQACPPPKNSPENYELPPSALLQTDGLLEEFQARNNLEDPAGLRPIVSPPARKQFRSEVHSEEAVLPFCRPEFRNYGAFGDIGTTFRGLEWRRSIFSGRVVSKTPSISRAWGGGWLRGQQGRALAGQRGSLRAQPRQSGERPSRCGAFPGLGALYLLLSEGVA
jgi:hypothetical protein